MKQKICLHGLEIKNKNQIFLLLGKILPQFASKSRLKEKYLAGNDLIKYKSVKFNFTRKTGYKVKCLCGVMVISDKLLPINDIIIEYDGDSLQEVQKLVYKLLESKIKFTLEEPDLELRAKQLRGSFALTDYEAYDENSVLTALRCHLPWQIYWVNKSWGELLDKPAEKVLVRQLRVKLRRLRSSLTFFKPLLPLQAADLWKQHLKNWTDLLSDAREYDVALMTCAKIRRNRRGGEEQEAFALEGILTDCRQNLSKKVLTGNKINAITRVAADFLFFLQNAPVTEEYSGMRLKSFLRLRLSLWCDKLIMLPEKYPDMHDMEQLHQIRIKVKRFRYALQGVPEISASSALLRSLKSLQDMLGLLHDDYINDKLIENILAQHQDNEALRYEGAMFCGWERAKAEAALLTLPGLWESFCGQLEEWREENL